MIATGLFLLVCLAGGVGAALRFILDGVIKSGTGTSFPIGTTVINVSGSFGLGVLTGAASTAGLSPEWLLVLGGGLMGGYTTFSTASVETVRLTQAGRYAAALLNGIGMLVVSVLAAGLGLLVGGAGS